MIPEGSDIEMRQQALATARLLLDSGAVCFDAENPFRLEPGEGPGLVSPLHVDARAVLAYPHRRRMLLDMAEDMIRREVLDRGDRLDAVACRTEGQGVPFATLIADRLDLPMIFVRRPNAACQHKPAVEGQVTPGGRVLLVEQLATDGHRKAVLVDALQAAGAVVTDLFVVFQYGVFDAIHAHLAPLGVRLHALSTWWDLLDEATGGRDLPPSALEEVAHFLQHPDRWHPPAPDRRGTA